MIMDFFMKPGTKIKRWIFLGVIGMILSVIGIVEIFSKHEHNLSIKLLYLFLTFVMFVFEVFFLIFCIGWIFLC